MKIAPEYPEGERGSRRQRSALHAFTGWACVLALLPEVASAHSFGTPYVLPMPFWMYVLGCTGTLIVTFSMMGVFARSPIAHPEALVWQPHFGELGRFVGQWGLWLARVGASVCLLITIVAGLIGSVDPADSIGMTLFWVIFLLGLTYLTVLCGNLYALVDPWKQAVQGLERMGLDLSTPRFNYPTNWGYWPAFLLYLVLIWAELFIGPKPILLSISLIIFSAITFSGVVLFGKAAWFAQADVFSVFFGLVGKLAPVEYLPTAGGRSWRVRLRLPFVGVLSERPAHISLVVFVLFMLSSTAYDGIHDTAMWIGVFWKNLLWFLQPFWGNDLGRAQDLLMRWYLFYRQAGLLLFPLIYLAVYLLVLYWAGIAAGRRLSVGLLAREFCCSLLPIAVAYHFTHYCTFLLTQGANLPSLFSDPFGFGWNWLGIKSGVARPTLNMALIWHTQVAVLLAGHIVSVYLAHQVAVRVFPTHRRAVLSQLPLLAVMVAYTTLGLWILSLPLALQ